ncbi:MAG: ribosome biogenesis GTPase YlqF [Clostridia bacterium]
MDMTAINWYPGHMAKTKRIIGENLKNIDIVIEILDSRIARSSKNNEVDVIINEKPKLILLNKCSLSDMNVTRSWCSFYEKTGAHTLPTDCITNYGIDKLFPLIKEILKDKIERKKAKGMVIVPIKMMVLGVPNVGKSSLINTLLKSKKVKVEDRPGVTRVKQWITINKEFDILDMPGILAPKLESATAGLNLSVTGAIKDQINDLEYLAAYLLDIVNKEYPKALLLRYKVQQDLSLKGYEVLSLVGKKRGFLVSGGEIDTERTAIMVLDEFRAGKLGNISLERV